MWQSLVGRDVKRNGWRGDEGRESIMLESGHILREKRNAKRNADWKKEKINQASPVWLTACQGVFCGGVKNSAIALPCPPSPFWFSLPLSLFFIHHLPPHPSSHCRLLLNVSPNSPNISLTFHSIVPPLQLSLANPPIFSSGRFLLLLAEMHSLPAI